MLRRYHRDLGIPGDIADPVISAALTYSVHARQEASKDHVQHCLPVSVPMQFDLIEVEVDTENGQPVKWVIRFPINKELDLVLAVSSGYLVKTVWVNRSCDTHLMNLDRSRYDRPEPVEV